MGFYGNITNTSKTNFVFDKIYTNRKAMDENISKDGIFIGRYVLIEYGEITNDSFIRAYLINNKFYTTNTEDTNTEILYTADKNKVKDRYITNGIVIYTIIKNNKNEDVYTYYECNGGEFIEEEGIYRPTFSETPGTDIKNDPYFYNFNQDKAVEKYGGTRSRGYDGTVWVKSSVNNEVKYVNIAELNSVVPSFEMVADAPTMSPILPHFDTASNNVYYKLHWQPAWGMRIAEAKEKNGKIYSDYETSWSQEIYNPETGETSIQWYDPIAKSWKLESELTEIPTIKADIYFNHAAFDSQVGESDIHGVVRGIDNYIGITPDGLSGNEYNLHDGTSNTEPQVDTQQIHINLPAIGNMMSEAWDIIHGKKRDNSTVDSLQGRLNFFKDEIAHNEIPIQSSETEGYLVGSVINGATNYESSGEYIKDNILDVSLTKTHEHDDAWISTQINTSQGKDGDFDYHRKAIAIHHNFHPTPSSESQVDKNDTSNNEYDTKYNEEYLQFKTNFDNTNKNTLKLYTPYVDKAGHVVGENIETVTLPYGFKTIATNGRGTSTTENASTTPSNSNIVAENTQDTLNINSGNKWIRMDTTVSSDTLTIAHDIHETSSTTSTKTLVSETAATTFDVPTYSFDDAGHYLSHDTKTITVPYGYGKITGDSGNTSATATFDTLEIKADDAWIATAVSKDKVNITHTGPVTGTPTEVSDVEPEFGETFSVTDWHYDSKGHKYGSTTHTVKMPDGSYTPANSATPHTDIITSLGFTPRTGAITSTKANTDTLTLYNYSANSGNLDIKSTDTINAGLQKIQNHINGLDLTTSKSDLTWIIDVIQSDGQVTVARAGTDSLKINNYNAEGQGTGRIANNDVINIALAKLQNQIIAEEENRKNAINTLYGDNAENIADTFDTIKEIADFLEQDNNGTQSGIEKIISDISANTDAIEAEKLRATQTENSLSTSLTEEKNRAIEAESTLTTNLSNEILRAKGAESTLDTRITDLVGNTAVSTQIAAFGNTLGTAAKSDVNDFAPAGYYDDRVLTSVYEAKIASLEATITALEARIAALEPQPEPSVGE